MLHIVSTKNTPHHRHNNTPLLANYINSGMTTVPLTWLDKPFLTGSNFNFSVADSAVWNAPGVDNTKRHKMSFGTCNACHGGETRDNLNLPQDTQFVHITPRNIGVESTLSKFLIGNGSLSAPSVFDKPDPIVNSIVRPFGDLVRRQTDLANLSVQSCRATGFLQEAMFRNLRMEH